MALKQVKARQGRQQSAGASRQKGKQQPYSDSSEAPLKQVKKGQQQSRLICTVKEARNRKEPVKDPWSFLDCTEAPQWVDLSLEQSLIGEGDDPWFHQSHKHHVASLAGLNSDMSWLRLEHASRRKPDLTKRVERNFPSKDSATPKRAAGKENNPVKGFRQNVFASKDVKDVRRFQHSEGSKCALPGDKDTSSTRGALSATSYMSKIEGTESTKSGSSSRARLSNTSGQRDSARESGKIACRMNWESSSSSNSLSGVDENSVVSSTTPTCSDPISGASHKTSNSLSGVDENSVMSSTTPTCSDPISGASQKTRNSSGASFCPPGTSFRYSSEACLSNSKSLGFSSDTSLAESMTATSGLASSERQPTSSCSTLMEGSTNLNIKAQCDYDQFTIKDFTPENNSANSVLINCQQVARRVVKSDPTRVSDRRKDSYVHASTSRSVAETRASLVGLNPGKLFTSRTSNAQLQGEISLRLNSLTEDISQRTITGSKTVEGKLSLMRCSQLQLKVDKRDHLQGSLCTKLVSQSRDPCRLKGHAETMVCNQPKRPGSKGTVAGLPAPTNVSKSASSEQDLAALVAQHNQMVRTRRASTLR